VPSCGARTTIWLNTDRDPATGHQIFNSTGGAEYNIEIGVDGTPRLYTGAAGQTFVADLAYNYSADRKTIENFAAVVQSVERLKLLSILTTADIKAVGPGVWNGWKAQLIRTLYFETEPVLTGGFSEVNRAQRVAAAQAEFRAAMLEKGWPPERLEAYIAHLYPAYWLKVDLPHKIEHAHFVRTAEDADKNLATTINFDANRAVIELSVLAPDHPNVVAGASDVALDGLKVAVLALDDTEAQVAVVLRHSGFAAGAW